MSSTHRFETVVTAGTAALVVYLIANALELLLIREGLRPALLLWLSDLVPALAFGLATALWLDLRATRAARSAAEAANRAKDEVLAIVAHELRNPLTAISAAFQALEVAPTKEARVRPREVILTQAAHLSRMIEDLLDLGRVMNGKIKLQRVRLDLGAAARHAVEMLQQAGKLQQHDVTVDTESAWVHADGLRIEQIAVNLLSNAIKYTPAGGSIHVTARSEKRDAVLRIRDTGVGISPELLPSVFGLFVQGDQRPGRQPEGLGIGLSLVRRLVEVHGGTVQALSEGPGQGTTIEIRLPRASPPYPLFTDAVSRQSSIEHSVN
ncbi:MAG: HAMP domain-containing sensor histidine kinase [Vicinamibacterales bacterium]